MTPKSLLICIFAAVCATTVAAAGLRGSGEEKPKPQKEQQSRRKLPPGQPNYGLTKWEHYQIYGWVDGPGWYGDYGYYDGGDYERGTYGYPWGNRNYYARGRGRNNDDTPNDWATDDASETDDATFSEGYYSGSRSNGRFQTNNNWNYQNNNFDDTGYYYQVQGQHGGYTYQWEGYNQGGQNGNQGWQNRQSQQNQRWQNQQRQQNQNWQRNQRRQNQRRRNRRWRNQQWQNQRWRNNNW